MPTYTLTVMLGHYAVCQLPPAAPIPPWASGDDFCAITRTADELSIICPQAALPADLPPGVTVAQDWVLLRVEGPFAFDVIGVLASLATALAEAGVVLLAVATYKTDYLLVKAEQFPSAITALTEAGHQIMAQS